MEISPSSISNLIFVDLFAGLGGFHLALKNSAKCVFASEKNETLRDIYKKNFNIKPKGDITKIPIENIPKHDILCAGFPCQPFSKAGKQMGFADRLNGPLFNKIVDVLDYHRPSYFLLENVRNLKSHLGGG